MAENKLSIYVVERDYGTYFHCFLALVDETIPSETPNVIEQIHFNDDLWGFMAPEIIQGFKHKYPERVDDFHFFPYLGGKEADILPLWNHILKMVQNIKGAEIEFEAASSSPTAVNCRAGVKAAIQSLGIEFFAAYTKCYLGTEAFQPTHGKIFDYSSISTDLESSRKTHQRLVAGLK